MIDPHQDYDEGVPAPPRILLWGVIGLFVLFIVGLVAGLYIFRNVLTTGQQYRVVTLVPFMEALMPHHPTPPGGIIPTAAPQSTNSISPDDLLNMPLNQPEQTEEPHAENTTPEPTNVSVLQPTATATFTPTPAPTLTPTATPTLTPTPAQAAQANPGSVGQTRLTSYLPSHRLYGFRHEQQTWNNCGPANITMALSYYGWTQDQTFAAEFLKPGGREDKNVNPIEMVNFVNEQTAVRALTRIGGDLDLLKTLLTHDFPVIIETGYMPEGYDWIGHYQTIVGYDEAQRLFYIYDSFLGTGVAGEGISETYEVIDRGWQAFNRTFIIIYEPSREGEVQQILGEMADPLLAAERAFDIAQMEARANPQNAFPWFNMGTALTRLGRYEEAAAAFDRARQVGLPWRMLWYQFGPFEAYFNVGRFDDVISLAEVNLTNGASDVEETYYWQGRALAAKGEAQRAAEAFRRALLKNPRYTAARDALDSLS